MILMTAADVAEANRLAEMLVGAQLAACVQILPHVNSVYRWKGMIERETEVLLIAKTARSKFEKVEREVRALHSYETPERHKGLFLVFGLRTLVLVLGSLLAALASAFRL
jgi:periplasmic divalent cation tolerance protein